MQLDLQGGAQFVGIPNIFLHHYKNTIRDWLSHYQKRGPHCKIWLNTDLLGPTVIGDGASPGMVPSIKIAALRGDAVQTKKSLILVVRPSTQVDAKIITKHCEDLEDFTVLSDNLRSRPVLWLGPYPNRRP